MRKWTKRWTRITTTQVIPWSLAVGRKQKWETQSWRKVNVGIFGHFGSSDIKNVFRPLLWPTQIEMLARTMAALVSASKCRPWRTDPKGWNIWLFVSLSEMTIFEVDAWHWELLFNDSYQREKLCTGNFFFQKRNRRIKKLNKHENTWTKQMPKHFAMA